MATRKQAAPQEDEAIPQAVPVPGEIVGDGTGEALPDVSQVERDASAVPIALEHSAELESSPESNVETFTARVLCSITLGANRYQPNDVIEGIPADVLAQYAGSLDSHPDAVAYAQAEGGTTHQFEA